jgi:hypothetical protein
MTFEQLQERLNGFVPEFGNTDHIELLRILNEIHSLRKKIKEEELSRLIRAAEYILNKNELHN